MQNVMYLYALVIMALILIAWFYPHKIKPLLVMRKLRKQLFEKQETQTAEQLLESLYKETNPHQVSSRERDRLNIKSDEFTYGEIVFLSFMDVLGRLDIKPGEVFYDLGSGSGKAVFTAALSYDFSKACGIEYLPKLHTFATQKLASIKNLIQWHNRSAAKTYEKRIQSISFINGNFLDIDFSDATVLFTNATCFNPETWRQMVSKFSELPIGARVFMTTKSIDHSAFKLLFQEQFLMSWGMSTVSAYEKVSS